MRLSYPPQIEFAVVAARLIQSLLTLNYLNRKAVQQLLRNRRAAPPPSASPPRFRPPAPPQGLAAPPRRPPARCRSAFLPCLLHLAHYVSVLILADMVDDHLR